MYLLNLHGPYIAANVAWPPEFGETWQALLQLSLHFNLLVFADSNLVHL